MGRVVLDRRLRRFGARGNVPFAARLARGLRGGFRWDAEDSKTKEWYPQGIDGRGDVVLVTWYSKLDGAARLSIADTGSGRYGHVALVLPDGKPVKTHAGGLAWREDWLYVADTNKGLRLFDLRRFSGAHPPPGRLVPAREQGPALLLRLGRRRGRARCWSASTATRPQARGWCAGSSRPAGCWRRRRRARRG